MAVLNRRDLMAVTIDAIRRAGARVLIETAEHPSDLVLVRPESATRIRLYIWNLTHGGGSRRPDDEFRIQITGVEEPVEAPRGAETLLLGWDDGLQVFAAFDPSFHRHPGASASVQIIREALVAAATHERFAHYRRANDEIALAFPPDLLLGYVDNQPALHSAASDEDLLVAIEAASAMSGTAPEPLPEVAALARRQLVRKVRTYAREAGFRRRVMAAYQSCCAACDCQLRLTEAAHIVPVVSPTSTDETCNGLAMCVLHHKAYDDGLLGVMPDYRIELSTRKLADLHAYNLSQGREEFSRLLRPEIRLPVSTSDRPRPDYLQSGLQIRGW